MMPHGMRYLSSVTLLIGWIWLREELALDAIAIVLVRCEASDLFIGIIGI